MAKDIEIYDYDHALTTQTWHEVNALYPEIKATCQAWAETQDQFKACTTWMRKRFIINASNRFYRQISQQSIPPVLPSFRDTYFPTPPAELIDSLHKKFEDVINTCKTNHPLPGENIENREERAKYVAAHRAEYLRARKERAACMLNGIEQISRGAIIGLFAATKPPSEEYEMPKKKKVKPGKITSELALMGVETGRQIGNRIKWECKQYADDMYSLEPKLDKYDYYKMCRESSIFYVLGRALGDSDRVADHEARRAGLKVPTSVNVDEISKEIAKKMVQAYSNVMKEVGKLDQTVKQDVEYYQSRRIKRVFASTIGSALSENPLAGH
ncbi:MAG: hypothetical protein ASUL_09894 [Candidatus Aramenus sulfurataquae]|uniref:Uncharacterized protein n=1 Tax=Candidatus Aramenus sulfurataquae TaxID=1326980 RepID=W7L455_9CREN|nr:MAG: hypothetical protein ASUL_09894 [Candidatus Aramenus sulfurataquae]